MAFVNERIPQNERREFQISKYEKKTPSKWTINREKNIILFKCGSNWDEPSEIEFMYVWKNVQFHITLKQETFSPNIVKWSMISFCLPNEYNCEKDKMIAELREAMKVYGVAGLQLYDEGPIEVIINF